MVPEWVAARKGARGRPAKYPFATISVGEWFDIPVGDNQPSFSSMKAYCWTKSKDLRRKFICHQYPDGLIQVYRSE